MKRYKLFKWFLIGVVVLTLIFIWGNSILSAEQSSAISNFVLRCLGIDREPNADESHGVRKMGHFLEFLALGAELFLYFHRYVPKGAAKTLALICCGIFGPFMDETIQMFNDRSPQVLDIWIDIAGFTAGCVIVFLITCIYKRAVNRIKFQNTREKRRE